MRVTRPNFPTPAKAATTARLLLRPVTADDVAEFHFLRTQPEVMIYMATGKVDIDHDATRVWVDRFIPPNDSTTFQLAVEIIHPGVIIGCVGSHIAEPPTLGYMFRKEYWARGYATQAVQGWLEEYWKLPRHEIDLQSTMPESSELHWQGDVARELIVATIESGI